MKTTQRIIITVLLLTMTIMSFGQNNNQADLQQRLSVMEDKMAIKQVVDEFSNLADTKEIEEQVMLFTKDGVVESYANGQRSSSLQGREQLKQAFSGFLANFHTVYHQNGQQTIDLQGDKAEATSYCRVILVGEQEGKPTKTTLYTIYNDQFVREDNQWLIKHRKSNFVWREVEEVKP